MATVVFYNIILLSSTFFVWLSEKGRTRLDRNVLLGVAFFIVFIPSAIRYGIGTDYFNYLRIYESGNYDYYLKEPAFYFINWFLDKLEAHFQWLFVILAFVFTVVVFKAYPRKNAWLIHLLFFSTQLYFSFNGLRQAAAIAWCFLALFCFFERRYITFIVLTLAGATFHQSALFVTVAGLAALLPINRYIKTQVAPIVFISFILFTFISINVVLVYMEQILNWVGLSKYASYFSSTVHFVERDFGSGIGVLAKILFSIYIICQTKKILELNENYWLLILLIFVFAIATVLANEIVIFNRVTIMFSIASAIGGFLLLNLKSYQQIHRLVLTFFIVFSIMSFIKEGFSIPTSYGDSKLNPYITIFEDK